MAFAPFACARQVQRSTLASGVALLRRAYQGADDNVLLVGQAEAVPDDPAERHDLSRGALPW
jgi:hypothetical protein